jgi:hypothetical protein
MAAMRSITHPDEVQVWDIRLEVLQAFGWSAAAAVAWAVDGLTPAQAAVLPRIWEFTAELERTWTDWRPPFNELHDFLSGPPGARTCLELDTLTWSPGYWSGEFSVDQLHWPVTAARLLPMKVRLGVCAGTRFMEYLLTDTSSPGHLTVHVQPSSAGGHPLSYTWSIRAAKGHRTERQRLQRFDAAEPAPIVLIDQSWSARPLAESVMAQIIDWHFRVARGLATTEANFSSPAADAIEWWIHWLGRVSNNDEVGFDDALAIARRSVRPATPSEHHTYWRESLRPRSHTAIDRACGMLGISRSTAYTWLRQAGLRAGDFDSTAALVNALRREAPRRRLTAEQRNVVSALVESGMSFEAARKLERRTRALPEQQRHERLLAAVRRAEIKR